MGYSSHSSVAACAVMMMMAALHACCFAVFPAAAQLFRVMCTGVVSPALVSCSAARPGAQQAGFTAVAGALWGHGTVTLWWVQSLVPHVATAARGRCLIRHV